MRIKNQNGDLTLKAIAGTCERAEDKDWGLRVAAYEFTEDSVLEALGEAVKMRKVDVRIVYHAREVDNTVTKKALQREMTVKMRREGRELPGPSLPQDSRQA
jgi:hypothetical protein